jgi:hypothetical protein
MVNADDSAVEFAREIDKGLRITAHIVCPVSIARNRPQPNQPQSRSHALK